MEWAFLDTDTPFGFAHRGGNEVAPENTVAAFQHATDLGYRYLETDVHPTRDGVLVAFHDSGLERVAGIDGVIGDHDWAELSSIDLGDGCRIPTLDELLSTFPDARFNIDPKADGSVAPLAAIITRYRAIDRVCVGSFNDDRIEELRQRLGPALCASPGPRELARLSAASWGFGTSDPAFGVVQVPMKLGPVGLTAKQIDRFQNLDLQVHVWTVNDDPTMRRLLNAGADALMTDRTTVLKGVLGDRGEWPQGESS